MRRAATTVIIAGALALSSGCAGSAGSPVADLVPGVLGDSEGLNDMQHTVADLVVPGPAYAVSAASLGSPNRIGSLEVPVRAYTPLSDPWATLVWAHGGSFVRGTLDWPESDWVAARFADAGIRVVAVDYALASEEVKAPAPSNDVAAAVQWARDTFSGPLMVGGASAGAHLAALAALTLSECAADEPVIAIEAEGTSGSAPASRDVSALALLYPTLHRVQVPDPSVSALTQALPTQRQFDARRIDEMYRYYLGEDDTAEGEQSTLDREPCAATFSTQPRVVGELGSEELTKLPPTVIVNADADDLRASGEQFAAQLAEARVPVVTYVQSGTVHGYMNRPTESAGAEADGRETIARFVEDMRRITES